MKRKSWFYRFLKWIGVIKTHEINKKDMCESAKSTCNKNCESCAWNERGVAYEFISSSR